jgi:hypothetical protein
MDEELNDTALKVNQTFVGDSDIHKWDVTYVSCGGGGGGAVIDGGSFYAKYGQAFYCAVCFSYTCYLHTCFRD